MADDSGKDRMHPVDEAQLLRAAACDWRLSRGDVGVLAVILKHADGEWLAFPGHRLIAEQARLAPSNVPHSIHKLERYGYLSVIRRGQRKRQDYRLLQSPEVRRSAPARKSSGFGKSAPARKSSSEKRSAPVDRMKSAPVDGKHLLLSIGAESTYEITSESTGAARALLEQERQEQIAKRREGFREEYRQALVTHPEWAKRMEGNREIRAHIEDLIEDKAA